ncbi:MAG TPA: Dps family protein [Pyrinomonadaceae bacterium]|nr:Dps family protein [Pyrinomonadaceae bacterium]
MAQATKKVKATEKIEKQISKTNSSQNPIVQSLQIQLANSYLLNLNYKHYHWQTFGPLFRDLHHLFDELAAEVYETTDVLAERTRMIGQNPLSHFEDFLKEATVKPAAKGTDMRQMLTEARENLLIVIKEMRDAVKTADEENDPGTADVFTRFVQIHEKHEWFLRDMLEKRDGLTS